MHTNPALIRTPLESRAWSLLSLRQYDLVGLCSHHLREDDSIEMVSVLSNPALYEFTGGIPPTEAELADRYSRQVNGPSSAQKRWHNWIVRLATDNVAVGYVQATVGRDIAEIAWVIGVPWQGNGYASEAVRALKERLVDTAGVSQIEAHIHPDHQASQHVARAVGLHPTGETVDGEETWSWQP
ncbi:MAG: GNAT family N-acetyltransferase [Acidimicrobiia bacterium]|nr:GNAT family N-acetyltransferase [Acidimicrobiia bacterium]